MAKSCQLVGGNESPEYKNVRIYQQAYTIGDIVMLDRTAEAAAVGVDVVPATSSTITANIYGVAMETVTTAATTLLICIVTPKQYWAVDTTNTATLNDNMQRMIVGASAALINNTHTDAAGGIFQQTGYISANRIVGRFLPGFDVTA